MTNARARGFTLIELIMVLVVVGLLLAFSPVVMDSLIASKELESEVARLGGIIESLRNETILSQAQHAIHYDTDNHRYAMQVPVEVEQESANPDEESNRVRIRILQVFEQRSWSVAEASDVLAGGLPGGYAVKDGRVVQAAS